MVRKKFRLYLFAGMLGLSCMACESPVGDEVEQQKELKMAEEGNVRFKINVYEQIAFGRGTEKKTRTQSVEEVCSRITLAVFKGDEKVKTVSQSSDKEGFGDLSVNLSSGTYKVLVVAHNGEGTPTITKLDEIKFKDNKVTDTFCYYGDIQVGENAQEYNLLLKRVVGMFRLVVEDVTPKKVTQMKFYYTGGSSTLDGTTGFGAVNSRQTEVRNVSSTAYSGGTVYEIYTIPHNPEKKLKIVVTGLDNLGDVLYERTFEDVPLSVNKITQYSGSFFSEEIGGLDKKLILKVNTEWEKEDRRY